MTADASLVSEPGASAPTTARYWRALREGAERSLGVESLADAPERSYLWPRLIYDKTLKDSLSGRPLKSWLELERAEFSGFPMRNSPAFVARLADASPQGIRHVPGDDGAAANLNAAMALLAEVWPDAAAELDQAILGVAWTSSDDGRAESFSDPQRFGVIHVDSTTYRAAPAAKVATALVHEAAHHALFVETSIDPLIPEDYQKPVFSPIRRETRPAIGVLHGAFAASRMGQWARRLAARRGDGTASAEVSRLRSRYLLGLRPALDGLREIRFSARGTRLMADMESRLPELEALLG